MLPYSAAKFALVGFSEGLHAELRHKGIRVTTVCPGLMRTGGEDHVNIVGDVEFERRWFTFAAKTPGLAVSTQLRRQQNLPRRSLWPRRNHHLPPSLASRPLRRSLPRNPPIPKRPNQPTPPPQSPQRTQEPHELARPRSCRCSFFAVILERSEGPPYLP